MVQLWRVQPAGALPDGQLLFTSSVSFYPNSGGIARARGWMLRGSPAGTTRDTIANRGDRLWPAAIARTRPSDASGVHANVAAFGYRPRFLIYRG